MTTSEELEQSRERNRILQALILALAEKLLIVSEHLSMLAERESIRRIATVQPVLEGLA